MLRVSDGQWDTQKVLRAISTTGNTINLVDNPNYISDDDSGYNSLAFAAWYWSSYKVDGRVINDVIKDGSGASFQMACDMVNGKHASVSKKVDIFEKILKYGGIDKFDETNILRAGGDTGFSDSSATTDNTTFAAG